MARITAPQTDGDELELSEEADDDTLARIEERDRVNLTGTQEERAAHRVGAIAVTAEKNSLATKYGTDAPYGAIYTADPGTTGTSTGEVTGGAPAYNRKAISWGAAAAGVITGSCTFDVPTGTTVTYTAVCASVTPGTADVKDRIAITSQAFASQGTLTVNYTYTQS